MQVMLEIQRNRNRESNKLHHLQSNKSHITYNKNRLTWQSQNSLLSHGNQSQRILKKSTYQDIMAIEEKKKEVELVDPIEMVNFTPYI